MTFLPHSEEFRMLQYRSRCERIYLVIIQTHRGSPFPTVAEAIQEDLDEYRTKEGEVSKLKNAMVCYNAADFELYS